MFNIGNKKIQEMMKKLNMNVREIDSEEVIIKSKGKKIMIRNPKVMVVDMVGQDVYQITGDVDEIIEISEADIKTVMDKTGKDRKTVVQKLEELNNDLVKAIKELKEK